MSDQKDIELAMLRSFYESWINLHAIKNDKLHRKQKEQAAQVLYEQSVIVAHFYNPTRLQVVK